MGIYLGNLFNSTAQTKPTENIAGTIWVTPDEDEYRFGKQTVTYYMWAIDGDDFEAEGTYKQTADSVHMEFSFMSVEATIKGNLMEITETSKEDNSKEKFIAKKKVR